MKANNNRRYCRKKKKNHNLCYRPIVYTALQYSALIRVEYVWCLCGQSGSNISKENGPIILLVNFSTLASNQHVCVIHETTHTTTTTKYKTITFAHTRSIEHAKENGRLLSFTASAGMPLLTFYEPFYVVCASAHGDWGFVRFKGLLFFFQIANAAPGNYHFTYIPL